MPGAGAESAGRLHGGSLPKFDAFDGHIDSEKACVPKETRKAIQLFKRGAGVSDEAKGMYGIWFAVCVFNCKSRAGVHHRRRPEALRRCGSSARGNEHSEHLWSPLEVGWRSIFTRLRHPSCAG